MQHFETKDELRAHLEETKNYKLPEDRKIWDQPQYFFPTFEDDALLFFLDDDEDEEDENQNIADEFEKHSLNET